MKKHTTTTATRYLLIPALAFLSSGAWSYASAATYHVRKDGSDSSCNGSANTASSSAPNCAFSTIQKGVNAAQAGDTVTVHAGDYSAAAISSVRAGTSSAPITIQAASGETATIGAVTVNSGHNYLTVQDFQVTGFQGPAGLFRLNANNTKILNNYFYSNKTQDYYDAIGIYMNINTSGVLIDGNTFDGKSTPNKVGPSIYIPIAAKGSNQKISHNIFKDMVDPERVMDLNGFSNSTISNNEVRNITYNGANGAHVDIFQYWVSGEPTQNVIIENNYFHDLQSQIGDLVDSTTANNITFRNNVFANMWQGNSAMFGGSPYMKIYNNTFYRVGNGVQPLLFNYAPGANNADIRNNIFYNCGNSNSMGWYGTNGSNTIKDYNFVANGSNAAKSGFSEPHAVNGGDPAFVAAYSNCVTNACDFHIKSTSVVKGKGTPISGITTDMSGASRSSAPSIGAYEAGGTVSASLNPPTNLRYLP
ncbi:MULTISPECIES: chondroitinase-B domain-containing protein [Methylomicrobium]|uniref:Right handed beta helix domain-containing protein n=1 Tax=Methylomicrobium album BG8 TaxID=686340 RepID=H8GM01_METAL|nr:MULTISPECIES: chondroitinase-B domain-containing protein [Methylomicrobium]EIC28197.1 hypothetical protein Metal_0339 [Methylomicrobium album BG8]